MLTFAAELEGVEAGVLDIGSGEVDVGVGAGVLDVGAGEVEEVELINTTWPYMRKEITR